MAMMRFLFFRLLPPNTWQARKGMALGSCSETVVVVSVMSDLEMSGHRHHARQTNAETHHVGPRGEPVVV
jgi:hypothetical protein